MEHLDCIQVDGSVLFLRSCRSLSSESMRQAIILWLNPVLLKFHCIHRSHGDYIKTQILIW